MSLHATAPVDATADVSLRVPRGEAGDLESGVADGLAAVEAVSDVSVRRVTSVTPTWTDIRVDADVALTLELDSEADPGAAAAADLEDGFGVTDVNEVSIAE